MPDRIRKPERETPHRDKLCKTCRRPFAWRKDLARDWDVARYCSEACRGQLPADHAAQLEAAILNLLEERGPGKTICPSEAAKMVGGTQHRSDWEPLMEPARAAARRLVAAGQIEITQHGRPVDAATARGPIRLKLR